MRNGETQTEAPLRELKEDVGIELQNEHLRNLQDASSSLYRIVNPSKKTEDFIISAFATEDPAIISLLEHAKVQEGDTVTWCGWLSVSAIAKMQDEFFLHARSTLRRLGLLIARKKAYASKG